jgi:hypothetical protein
VITSAQRAEIQEAVNRERARCARVLEVTIERLGGAKGPPEDKGMERVVWAILCERLDAIKKPWRVRQAEKRAVMPGRLRRCCGICGGDDHTAPRCPHPANKAPVVRALREAGGT